MRKSINKALAAILIICILISDYSLCQAAGADTNEKDVYCVLIGANFRGSPSQSGKWLMTLPTGVFVVILDKSDSSYWKAEYGDTIGYVYKGCIQKTDDCSYQKYKEQFPEIYANGNSSSKTGTESSSVIKGGLGGSTTVLTGSSSGNNNSETSMPETVPEPAEVLEAKVLAQSNFRNSPSVEGTKIGMIPEGTMVKVIDAGDNGFTHISYGGSEGYIYTRCISLDERKIQGRSGSINTIIVDDRSEGRGAPTYSENVAPAALYRHTMAASATAAITGGRAVEDNAAIQQEIQEAIAEPATPQQVNAIDGLTEIATNIISKRTSIRSLPDQESNKIATISAGTNIVVLGVSESGYTMVQYDGVIGYVLENCVASSIDVNTIGGEATLFKVTAYCSCKKCCGNYSPEVRGGEAHTATGTVPEEGRTIAVDPRVIPYGTKVYIDGYGTYVAEDCGGGIKGNHIDMYFATHEAAIQFGSRRLYCSVVQ